MYHTLHGEKDEKSSGTEKRKGDGVGNTISASAVGIIYLAQPTGNLTAIDML